MIHPITNVQTNTENCRKCSVHDHYTLHALLIPPVFSSTSFNTSHHTTFIHAPCLSVTHAGYATWWSGLIWRIDDMMHAGNKEPLWLSITTILPTTTFHIVSTEWIHLLSTELILLSIICFRFVWLLCYTRHVHLLFEGFWSHDYALLPVRFSLYVSGFSWRLICQV
jgi:hypothetical protein